MKLTRAEISGYRTFVERTAFRFSDGMNVLVGRNNCGKSNLLSAITLAMDPDVEFDKTRDSPAQKEWSVSRVVLDFHLSRKDGPEQTLLRYAQEYEEGLGVKRSSTYATRDMVQLVVEHRKGIRQEYFQAAGAGARRASSDDERLQKLIGQFRKSSRYVLVRSGESLESLLKGRFRDILHLVMKDHLRQELADAHDVRERYEAGLQRSLLKPLQERIKDIVSEVFPDITSASLMPRIPDLDETLAGMRIELQDKARTDLLLKGTGVRGGVLLALLRYLADQSRRSIVIAVEEPEAFLHPGAQEGLRDGLEALAGRDDVTLLVTTHSPFIVSRAPKARIIALRKDLDGCTVIRDAVQGSSSYASALSDLFRDPGLADMLSEATELTLDGYRAVMVVEGETDAAYLRIAAKLTGRARILDHVRIVPAGGAEKAVVKAILLKARLTVPVLVLLDHDQMGRASAEKLKSLVGFSVRREIVSLVHRGWVSACATPEAEDLWPNSLLERFVKKHGDVVLAEKVRIGRSENFRYGLTGEGKELIGEWLAKNAKPSDCVRWGDLIDEIEKRVANWK